MHKLLSCITLALVILLSVTLLSGCDSKSSKPSFDSVLVSINDINYTKRDFFNYTFERFQYASKEATINSSIKEFYLNDFIRSRIFLQYATHYNFYPLSNQEMSDIIAMYSDPNSTYYLYKIEPSNMIKEHFMNIFQDIAFSRMIKDNIDKSIDISSDEFNQRYTKFVKNNNNSYIVNLKAIPLSNETQAKEILELLKKYNFEEMSQKYAPNDTSNLHTNYILISADYPDYKQILERGENTTTIVKSYGQFFVYRIGKLYSIAKLPPNILDIKVKLKDDSLLEFVKHTLEYEIYEDKKEVIYQQYTNQMINNSVVRVVDDNFTLGFMLYYFNPEYAVQLFGKDFYTYQKDNMQSMYNLNITSYDIRSIDSLPENDAIFDYVNNSSKIVAAALRASQEEKVQDDSMFTNDSTFNGNDAGISVVTDEEQNSKSKGSGKPTR